jgi:hypothetical protein
MAEPTSRRRLLAAASVAQLATGVAGMAVAVRRRHPYDLLGMRGRADAIARDTLVKGTALSAPVSNLLAKAVLTAVAARRPSRGAARASVVWGRCRWPVTWANGSCGGACARRAGTPWSRRWSWPAGGDRAG